MKLHLARDLNKSSRHMGSGMKLSGGNHAALCL